MRKLWFVVPLLLCGAILARGQVLAGRHILAGSGIDTPIAVATDSQGFVYVAGNTTSEDFPISNALEAQPPQGALNVSVNGAPFVNSGLNASTANIQDRGVSAVAASSDGMLVIASGALATYHSTDGGVTWKATVDVLSQAGALAVDPLNPSNIYELGHYGGFCRSSDGGTTCQATATAPPNSVVIVPPNLFGPYQPPPIGVASITIDPRNPATLYVWANNSVYSSTDSAQSWQLLSIPSANAQFQVSAFALASSQPNVLYALVPTASNGDMLLKSTDAGSTWTPGANFNPTSYANALAVDPTDAFTVWVTAADGTVKKSADSGATFQTIANLGASLGACFIAIDPANPTRVYVATSTGVSETSDGGATWSTVFSGYAGVLYAAPSRIYAFSGAVPATVFLAKLDPALSQVIYSTYLWTGSVSGIAVDSQDNVVLTGIGAGGGIVMKVSANDSSLLYTAILSGAQPNAIATDASGNVVIAGSAWSLAATKGAYQSAPPGPCASLPVVYGVQTEWPPAFAAKLNANGEFVYATYIAGSCGDSAYGLALDSSGAAYIAGQTYSHDFPVTPNAMTAKFPGNTSSGFVAKLSPAGDQLLYSSFLGGGDSTAAHAVTLDSAGNVYLAGSTEASPTAGASQAMPVVGNCNVGLLTGGDNAFVLKMTPSAAPAAFLATFGGSCAGEADSIALDAAGNIWLAGYNGSADFATRAPIAGLATVPLSQAETSGFVAELNPTGSSLLSATLTDYNSVAAAANSTAIYYFGPLGNSVLVAKIDPTQVAPISLDEIVQFSPLLAPAARVPSPVAPGEIVRILGRGIGPQSQVGAKLTAAGRFPTSVGGVQVTFNGVPAPLVSVQASQIECIAPFELDGLASAVVEVRYNGQISNSYTVGILAQNPDIIAVVNSDWTVNSPTNLAKPGSRVSIFLTGLGQTIPPSVNGALNQLPPAQLQNVPAIDFQYAPANVTFIGAAAFEVAGVYQLNMTLPSPAASPFPVYIGPGSWITATVYIAQ